MELKAVTLEYVNNGRNNSEVYSASKAGVIMLTKYLASHYANIIYRSTLSHKIGILNNQDKRFQINYSYKTPAGRMASTNDMQSVLEMLISKKSNYINGSNIVVDRLHLVKKGICNWRGIDRTCYIIELKKKGFDVEIINKVIK